MASLSPVSIQIINTSGSTLAFICQLIVGLTTFIKMRQSKGAVQVKALFILSFCLSVLTTICIVLKYALFWNDEDAEADTIALEVCSGTLYLWFLLSLLGTLVMRLYITFKGSVLEMSRHTIRFFVILFVIEVILSITIAVLTAGDRDVVQGDDDHFISILTFISFLFLYFIGSASAVHLFVANLSELSRLQAASQTDLEGVTAKDMSLNVKQQKTLRLSAKYILLFLVAISSTILSFLLLIVQIADFLGLFWSIDLCVNVLCLYLQFAFAADHYRKCCCCLDSCCRAMVSNRVKRVIHRESGGDHAPAVGANTV